MKTVSKKIRYILWYIALISVMSKLQTENYNSIFHEIQIEFFASVEVFYSIEYLNWPEYMPREAPYQNETSTHITKFPCVIALLLQPSASLQL